VVNPLWFFLIVITLFPLGIGPDPQQLARIAPGVAWVAALLASLLALERLFRDDFSDGSLEQLVLPLAIPVLIFASAAMEAASQGLPIGGYLAILGAMLLGSATLAPFATAVALRITLQ
jgi:heme exporter protein B